jgi:hypothetical protein
VFLYELSTEPKYFIRSDPSEHIVREDLIPIIQEAAVSLREVNNNFYKSFCIPELKMPLPRVASLGKPSQLPPESHNDSTAFRTLLINPGHGVVPCYVRGKEPLHNQSAFTLDSGKDRQGTLEHLLQEDSVLSRPRGDRARHRRPLPEAEDPTKLRLAKMRLAIAALEQRKKHKIMDRMAQKKHKV